MKVIDLRSVTECEPPKKTVLCLGNFDGVHLGHRRLIDETVRKTEYLRGADKDIKSGAWFFNRSPFEIINGTALPHLADLEQKLRLFADMGLDVAFVYDFEDIGGYSPELFVDEILKKECGCVFAVCGYNFRFGRDAHGNAETLKELMNGNAEIVEKVVSGERSISSSLIRNLISEGNIEEANALLGRNYSFCAEVVHGKQLGRKLGIPTINQNIPEGMAKPKNGIYISQTVIDGKKYGSVSNFGYRPSVTDNPFINCETYILNFKGNLYGKNVRVEFIKRLRGEKKFDSVDALKSQINEDIRQTEKYFKSKEA